MRATPHRKGVNKSASAKNFRNSARKTHIRNLKVAPQRGGWRL